MLQELRVENLLLIDRAELRLAPGLNVVTGETGAGKTLLAQALDLLLGGRAGSGVVRGGSAEAYVEGVFSVPPSMRNLEILPTGAEEIVLARRVWPDGRTRAYVCGRSATVGDLRDLGGALVAFYGQHEHRRLMLSTVQLDVLDAHCGPEQALLREQVGEAHARVRAVEERMGELKELAAGRERELDLLAYELEEIERVAPDEDEARELAEERERLRHLETLQTAATGAAEAVSGEGGEGAAELLASAAAQLHSAAGIDSQLVELCERVNALAYEAQDVGAGLRSYALGLEGSPGRLEEVEERLAQFARLERKHGGGVAQVLAHADRCRARRDELERAEVALGEVEAELSRAGAELDRLAGELSERRRRAAPALAGAVRERLAELAMAEAEFSVEVGPREGGCGPRGIDAVELLIAANPGLPAGPLREIASGGELSRVMLAILSVAHGLEPAHADGPRASEGPRASARGSRKRARRGGAAESGPLLVFDEIDAGIGGHTARAVGEHLRALSAGRQVLCITHLPQVAALAARHFTIAKDTSGVPARTTVSALDGDSAVVGELVRMLGADEGDRAAARHARDLLRAA
ncbi:MAG TPA: DNA repair protein RecN [Solirubrobacteraceae bacterium]|nr:DNA repair protein RecN [Solirubrobacteraceae bacterium]